MDWPTECSEEDRIIDPFHDDRFNIIESVEIFVKIFRETEAAVLIDSGGANSAGIWLPKSQIRYDEPDESGYTDMRIPEWLAVKKGVV